MQPVRRVFRRRFVIAGAVLAFAAAGGGAYAATQTSGNPQSAFFNDVAHRLGVSSQRLTSALRGASIDQLNAAVKAGRLTQAQANAIKRRIEQSAGVPFGGPGFFGPGPRGFGPPPFGGPVLFGPGGPFAAAASYLGLSLPQFLSELRSGHSPAQIAKAKGKSVVGLEQAITRTVKSRLDQAVSAGRLSKPQEQKILSLLSSRLSTLVNRTPVQFAGPPVGPPPQIRPWPHHPLGSVPTPYAPAGPGF